MGTRSSHDIAIAAPAALIYAMTTVLLLMLNIELVAWLAVLASIVVPFLFGLYVFSERSFVGRLLLSLWGPVGQWGVLLAVWYFVWRRAADLPPWVLALATFGPLLALMAASIPYWRQLSASSGRIGLGVLWVIALAEALAAMPLAEWLAVTAGVDTLAAVVVLFAPAAAFGTWAGLAIAAALPVPSDENEPVEAA